MKNKHRAACIVLENHPHHLDHLAPISALLDIELLTNDKPILSTAKKFYPNCRAKYVDYRNFNHFLANNYNIILSCFPKPQINLLLALLSQKKKKLPIWLPHGNSDKGYHSKHMEALFSEEIICVYGRKIYDFICEKIPNAQSKKFITIGNYRLSYYLKYRSFYQKKIKERFKTLNTKNKTILYSPTWNDSEKSCSFFKIYESLLNNLSNHFNLIIKLHPNTILSHKFEIDLIQYQFQHKKNLFFINNWPHIYSILEIADIYLGDMSSIGYDFLTFQRPMFFINQYLRKKEDKSIFLYQCGKEITPHDYDNIFSIIEKECRRQSNYKKNQQKIYNYAFAKTSEEKTRKEFIDLFLRNQKVEAQKPFPVHSNY